MPKSDRRPCRACAKPTKRAVGLCAPCDPAIPEGQVKADARRPEKPCNGCGKRTTAKSGTCNRCFPTYLKQGPITPEHGIREPGDWVNVRGVQRWVPRKRQAA